MPLMCVPFSFPLRISPVSHRHDFLHKELELLQQTHLGERLTSRSKKDPRSELVGHENRIAHRRWWDFVLELHLSPIGCSSR